MTVTQKLFGLLAAVALPFSANATEGYEQPLAGWNILKEDFNSQHPLDIVSFEWEYFMIHDEKFNGIVGYVVANPREKLGDIIQVVPNGGNVAFVGEQLQGPTTKEECFLWFCWDEAVPAGYAQPIADYHSFGTANAQYSADEKSFYAANADGWFGKMTPLPNGGGTGVPALHLTGKSEHYAWDLTVTQALVERDINRHNQRAFTTQPATDIGLPGEVWTVDALWPKTHVKGSVTANSTGEVIAIDGKGYRENSWGRYVLPLDGWDFMVFSEESDDGVLMVMQTYHTSKDLDFVDMSFYDEGKLVSERFSQGNLTWAHPSWKFDREARSCVPLETELRMENDTYLVEAAIDIQERQRPMLSNATIGTALFFIQEHFPTVTGTITHKTSGKVIHEFAGQAGGEFAYRKDLLPEHSNTFCNFWGWSKFSSEM